MFSHPWDKDWRKETRGTIFGLAANECIVLWTERMQTYICYWQNMYTIPASVHTTSIYMTWHETYGRWLTAEGD